MNRSRTPTLLIVIALVPVSNGLAQSTIRISAGPGGVQGTGPSYTPAISADGRHVAYVSTAPNLIAGGASGEQVYAYDRDPDTNGVFDEGNGITTLISIGIDGLPGNGTQGGFNGHFGVSISGNGRYVLWASQSGNLVAGDSYTFGAYDIFVRDRDPDTNGVFDEANAVTYRVNVGPGGAPANSPENGSERISLSRDGLLSSFSSGATNLMTTPDMNAVTDAFVHNLATGVTECVSVNSLGMQSATNVSRMVVLSGNGRYVAFLTSAPFWPVDSNGFADYYIHDRVSGATVLGSMGQGGVVGNNRAGDFAWGNDYGPSFSDDGRYFAFMSWASNLVPGDTNGLPDVFLNDRDPDGNGIFDEGNNAVTLLSVSSNGTHGNLPSIHPELSGDGRFAVYSSQATNLVPGDTNGSTDIFLIDRATGSVERASVSSAGVQANANSFYATISADGRYVAFDSTATNLVAGDTNSREDVFIRDRGPITLPIHRGDMNCDGVVDGRDVGAFLSALLSPATFPPTCNILNGDFNADSVVTAADTSGFVTCLLAGVCP